MLGHTVLSAATSDEALSLLRANEPDVVLVDIGLEGESGVDLAGAVRRERPEIRLVYATGQDAPADAPAGAMLRKPYGSMDITEVLKPFL